MKMLYEYSLFKISLPTVFAESITGLLLLIIQRFKRNKIVLHWRERKTSLRKRRASRNSPFSSLLDYSLFRLRLIDNRFSHNLAVISRWVRKKSHVFPESPVLHHHCTNQDALWLPATVSISAKHNPLASAHLPVTTTHDSRHRLSEFQPQWPQISSLNVRAPLYHRAYVLAACYASIPPFSD